MKCTLFILILTKRVYTLVDLALHSFCHKKREEIHKAFLGRFNTFKWITVMRGCSE